jgi:hypothetical protein
MIDWASLREFVVPEGDVKEVKIDGEIVWTKPGYRELYQRVEYIEATNDKPYMVSDVIADSETGIEAGVLFSSYMDRTMIGSRPTNGNTRFYFPYPITSTKAVYYGYNTGGYAEGEMATGTWYVARMNYLKDRTVSIYDADENLLGTKNMSGTLAQQTTPIGIFRQNRGYAGTNASRPGRIDHVNISQGTSVIREYIPCYRKSDGVIGMIDTFTEQFLTNQGDGEFTKGQDIPW